MPQTSSKEPAEHSYGSDEDIDDGVGVPGKDEESRHQDAPKKKNKKKAKKNSSGMLPKPKMNKKRKNYAGTFIRPVPSHLLLLAPSTTASRPQQNDNNNVPPGGSSDIPFTASTREDASPLQTSVSSSLPSPPHQPKLSLATVDPRIRRDFFAVRKRAFDEARDGMARSLEETIPSSVWDGVSSVEKEMILCCESTPVITTPTPLTLPAGVNHANFSSSIFTSTGANNIELYYPLDGVLSVEKETHFATILATQQHTMGTKSLAVAILERTMEQHLWEVQQQQQKQEEQYHPMQHSAAVAVDTKTRSTRFTRVQKLGRQQNNKNGIAVVAAAASTNRSNQSTDDCKRQVKTQSPPTSSRLERFLAAGGLKVLNEWLSDAASYELSPFSTLSSASRHNGKKSGGTSTDSNGSDTDLRASPTRPIVVSILRFLEHIPFDKTCVTESKINKQIQKLGKKITTILESYEQGAAPPEDIEKWTTDTSLSVTDALKQVGDAVEAVKKSWKVKAKSDTTTFPDPLASLREVMKSRVKEYVEFQQGTVEAGAGGKKPDWYRRPRANNNSSSNNNGAGTKRPRAVGGGTESLSAEEQKKRKTMEMAAKERMAEREKFQQQLAEVRKKRQEQLALLQEKLRKRMESTNTASRNNASGSTTNRAAAGGGASASSSSITSRVSWKDGEKTGLRRDRHVLEEVFLFDKAKPAALGTLT